MNRAAATRSVLAVMLGASFASSIGGLPFNTLPVTLGSLADALRLDPRQMGLLGSCCTGGYLLGALSGPLWIERVSWRLMTLASAVGVALALIASTAADDGALRLALGAFGFAAALMHCIGNLVMGALPNKERAFGTRQFVELVSIAAVLFVLPISIARAGYGGAAWTLVLAVAVLGISVFFVPSRAELLRAAGDGAAGADTGAGTARAPAATQDGAAGSPPTPVAGWLALAIFAVYCIGQVALWVFLDRMAKGVHASPTQAGTLFSMLKFVGGGSAALVLAIGDRIGARMGHVLAFAVLGAGLAALSGATSFWPFAFGTWIWEAGFTMGCLYQTAAISRIDPSSRSVVLAPAAFAVSSFLGPTLGGILASSGEFGSLLAFSLCCGIVTVAAWFWLTRPQLGEAP